MKEVDTNRLTQFSTGSGCGCKIAPSKLEEILKSDQAPARFKSLLVGNESRDDAAVLDLGNGRALISSTDFFTPIVDDPFDFGRIAAANSISDVYAMGGEPALAVAILGWPVDVLPSEMAAKVLSGGRKICAEAGIPLAGGHSINSKEPFFGLAVNGFVEIENLKKNNTAKEGDLLFLTKPIGTGIFGTAIKRGMIREGDYEKVIDVMCKLNNAGNYFGKIAGVHAMTDVTGFGLMGHLLEMADGSGLSAELIFSSIPKIDGSDFYTSQFCFPDNTYRNWNSYQGKVNKESEKHFIPLCDPQTNGGLLVSVSPGSVKQYLNACAEAGLSGEAMSPIGKMISRSEHIITVID